MDAEKIFSHQLEKKPSESQSQKEQIEKASLRESPQAENETWKEPAKSLAPIENRSATQDAPLENTAQGDLPSLQELLKDLEHEELSFEESKALSDNDIDDIIKRIRDE